MKNYDVRARVLQKYNITVLYIIIITFMCSFSFSGEDPSTLRDSWLAKCGARKIKTRTARKILRYEEVDRQLATLLQAAGADGFVPSQEEVPGAVRFSFAELFVPAAGPAFFPVTNNIVKNVPEKSLAGLRLFDISGEELGTFESRYPYSRSGERSFVLYFFQFRLPGGQLRGSGTDLLLDRFQVRWEDLSAKTCLILIPDGESAGR